MMQQGVARQPYSPATIVVAPQGYKAKADFYTDGVADDVQIQAAHTALPSTGGVILLVAGTFVIDTLVTITKSNVTIKGFGKGITIIQNNYFTAGQENLKGAIRFFNNSALINNIKVCDMSFNLNHLSMNGLTVYVSTTGTAQDYTFENLEFYNRAPDASGTSGAIGITADYGTTVAGCKLKTVTIKNCYFHDFDETNITDTHGAAIMILSDTLNNVIFENNYFYNTYGSTIKIATGDDHRIRTNWTFRENIFENTIQNYFSNALGNIHDTSRGGFIGIDIIDNKFISEEDHWLTTDDVLDIQIYTSDNLRVDGNLFMFSQACFAPGISSPVSLENRNSTFSNNIVYKCLRVQDPDGNIVSTYDNNIFYEVQGGGFMGGYGFHTPSKISNNLFYNCCLNPDTAAEYYQGIFNIETGGNVVENNVIFQDYVLTTPGAPTLAEGIAGNLNGTYTYKVTFLNNGQETDGGTTSAPITVSSKKVNLSSIPLGPIGTVARGIYRTLAGGVDGAQQLVTTLSNNTATTYIDNSSDATINFSPTSVPTVNQTLNNDNLKYVFCELSGGLGTEYPNEYKNNTIMGAGSQSQSFYLDSAFKHNIIGNTGLQENEIKNSATGGTPSVTDLAVTDQVSNNFKLGSGRLRERVYCSLKNTSGGSLVLGDVVIMKAVAAGDEFTTTTTEGDQNIVGMVAATIANNAYGLVQVLGKTTALKVNGTTDIAIGDLLGTYTSAGIAMKAVSGKMAFARALEAYTTNDSNGVLDADLITPRQAV